MNIQELKARRASKIAEMRAINDRALAANRDLDDGERTSFDALDKEVRSLDDQVTRAERLAAMERIEAAQERHGEDGGEGREMRQLLAGYSVARHIAGALGGRIEGREAEVQTEMSRGREARAGGGIHLAMPTEVFLESRSQTVGTDTAGGFSVGTMIGSMDDRRRPAMMVERMGATVLRGLVGNIDLPSLSASGSSAWVNENGNATRSAATFEKVSMGPKTVSAEYRLSRRLLLQSSVAIEDILRSDIGLLLAQALDLAAINGGGILDPLGILNTSGVTKETTETLFSDTTANLIAGLEIDDVTGTRGFLTNPTVMKAVRKIKDQQDHVIPVAEIFHGERVEVSTQVPTNIGAGANKSALIFGAWANLYVGYWSGVDILVNPYHSDVASNGGALLHAFLDADVAVRHPEAFGYAEI